MGNYFSQGINIILTDGNGNIIYREILKERNKTKKEIHSYLENKLGVEVNVDNIIIKKYFGYSG